MVPLRQEAFWGGRSGSRSVVSSGKLRLRALQFDVRLAGPNDQLLTRLTSNSPRPRSPHQNIAVPSAAAKTYKIAEPPT